MPLVPTTITATIVARAFSKGLSGKDLPKLASAVSNATVTYILTAGNLQMNHIVIGPGAGVGTGVLLGMSAPAMSALMLTKAASLKLMGRDAKKLYDSISMGVTLGLMAAVATGPVIGGGPGAGTGVVIGLIPSALKAVILPLLAGKLIFGSKIEQIASIIAFGIVTHISTVVKVSMTDVGAFTPPPVGPVMVVAPSIGRIA